MPRDSNGLYTLSAGNPVAAGTVVEVAWANPTMEDLRGAMTDSLDRFGRGGMSAALKIIDGAGNVPALAWSTEQNSGLYRSGANDLRFSVSGADLTRWTDSGFDIWNGTDWSPVTPLSVADGTADGQMIIWNNTTGGYDSTSDITVTPAGDVVATGNVTALSYSGDGSGLTGIDASPVGYGGIFFSGTGSEQAINDTTYVLVDGWSDVSPSDPSYPPVGVAASAVTDTITCAADGVWQLSFAATFLNNAYGGILVKVFINGVETDIASTTQTSSGPGGYLSVSASGLGFLADGDVADLRVINSEGDVSGITMLSGEFYLSRVG